MARTSNRCLSKAALTSNTNSAKLSARCGRSKCPLYKQRSSQAQLLITFHKSKFPYLPQFYSPCSLYKHIYLNYTGTDLDQRVALYAKQVRGTDSSLQAQTFCGGAYLFFATLQEIKEPCIVILARRLGEHSQGNFWMPCFCHGY